MLSVGYMGHATVTVVSVVLSTKPGLSSFVALYCSTPPPAESPPDAVGVGELMGGKSICLGLLDTDASTHFGGGLDQGNPTKQ